MDTSYGIKTTDGTRLIWWKAEPNEAFWAAKYQKMVDGLVSYQESYLREPIFQLLTTYLPKNGKIIEAGCGSGIVVAVMRQAGFDIEGIDYSAELVAKVNEKYPDLPVQKGNVLQIDKPDNYYQGYVSLGVIEHRYEGCEPFLKEAYRVLKPGGTAFISVPFFNTVRKYKIRHSLPDGNQLPFYQYGFQQAYFRQQLEQVGFHHLRFVTYGAKRGIQEDLPILYAMLNHRGLRRIFDIIETVKLDFAMHMLAAVVQKPE